MKKKKMFLATLGLTLLMTKSAFAYDVVKGDTLYKIANKNNITVKALMGANPQLKNTNSIYIGQKLNTNIKKHTFTAEEKDLLARLVRAEADGEPFKGKVAVVEVVLNRLNTLGYPYTVKEVIYQKGQFQPVANGRIDLPSNAESRRAVDVALTTSVKILPTNTLFFYNPKTAVSRWLDTRPTVAVINNHTFKR